MSMIINPFAFGSGGGSTAHRYWRVLITANDGNAQYMGFTEIEMRGSVGGANLLSPQTTNAAATSSSQANASNAAWRGADGNITNSGWLAIGTISNWWKYDFGNASHSGATTADVRQIVIYGSYNAPSASPKDFTLQWSDDDTNWTTVLTVTGQTGWTGASDVRTFNVP